MDFQASERPSRTAFSPSTEDARDARDVPGLRTFSSQPGAVMHFQKMAEIAGNRNRRRRANRPKELSLRALPENLQEFVHRNVEQALEAMDLRRSAVRSGLTGSRVLAQKTLSSYEGNLRQLEYFLALIQDWESMVILLPDSPNFCPSIDANSLVSFIDWKVLEEGTILVNSRNGQPFPSLLGDFVKADGGWSNPDCISSFGAAVSAVHIAKGMKGVPYSDPCENCIAVYQDEDNQSNSCSFHVQSPRLWRVGNPRSSVEFENRIKKMWKIDLTGYVPRGDTMLLPQELVNIRARLLSQNTFSSVRLWTMMLLSVKLFLRSSEVNIDGAQFLMELVCKLFYLHRI